MRSKWWRRSIIIVSGLMVIGVSLRAYMAISNGQPFMGANYWGAPVGTYLMLPVLLVGIPVGVWWAIRNW
jgi:hypothetical protein